METALIGPAKAFFLFIPTWFISLIIPIAGIVIFTYIMATRLAPLVKAAPDMRMNRYPERILKVLKIWLAQWRQPRYRTAGILHILIFFGFLALSIRSISLVIIGLYDGFVFPGLDGTVGHIYNVVKDVMATVVFVTVIVAAYRRGIQRPARYAVPEKYGHDHTGEAVFVLAVIATLMVSESLFEATLVAAQASQGMPAEFITPLTLPWLRLPRGGGTFHY